VYLAGPEYASRCNPGNEVLSGEYVERTPPG